MKNILKLMSKPAIAEQAGRMAIENCVVVLVLSLAAVSKLILCLSVSILFALLTLFIVVFVVFHKFYICWYCFPDIDNVLVL